MGNALAAKLQRIRSQALAMVQEDESTWHDSSKHGPGHHFIHFWVLVWKSFVRNRCPVRASALAYTTLLALVPLLAVAVMVSVAILKDKGAEPIRVAIDSVIGKVAPQLELVPKEGKQATGSQEVARRINEAVGSISTGTLGATAMIALVFVAISLLTTIEATFNDIWGVTKGRSYLMRVCVYWAVITLGPVCFALTMGLSSGPYLRMTQDLMALAPFLASLAFQFLPLIILSLTFAFFYKFIPNTPVQWRAALIGGLVAGYLWQLNSGLNVFYLSQVVSNSKIYGGLGVLPVFLLGLYFSWLILLFGSQVAYAFQNRKVYVQEKLAEGVNHKTREFVAVRIMTLIAERFAKGILPATTAEIAETLEIPSRLAAKTLEPLIVAKLVLPVESPASAFTAARPLEQISIEDITNALRCALGRQIETRADPMRELIRREISRAKTAEDQISSRVTLADLVREAGRGAAPLP